MEHDELIAEEIVANEDSDNLLTRDEIKASFREGVRVTHEGALVLLPYMYAAHLITAISTLTLLSKQN